MSLLGASETEVYKHVFEVSGSLGPYIQLSRISEYDDLKARHAMNETTVGGNLHLP